MAKVFNRTSEKGRRKQLRKAMPDAEIILWSRLKNKQLAETKFRRQYSIGKYIVDFYCAEKKLAIELDGESHFVGGAQEKDSGYRPLCPDECHSSGHLPRKGEEKR